MNAFITESKPDIPGAESRLAMLQRGAQLERERILGLDFIHESFAGECRDNCMTCENLELIGE